MNLTRKILSYNPTYRVEIDCSDLYVGDLVSADENGRLKKAPGVPIGVVIKTFGTRADVQMIDMNVLLERIPDGMLNVWNEDEI